MREGGKVNKEVTELDKKLRKYLALTKKALYKAAKAIATEKKEQATIVLDMASRYYKDALYFQKKNKRVTALAAVSYAHGWLDCGNKIGLFNVKDTKLFVIK